MKHSTALWKLLRYVCLFLVVTVGLVSIIGTGSGGGGDSSDVSEAELTDYLAAQGVTTTYYRDGDNDGYGDPSASMERTSQPQGYVTDNTDCDDTDASVNPGADEVCGDGIDNNCDGNVDEGCTGASSTIPDTGQTTCYDAAGNVLDPCPAEGEAFYGQDACYSINPPSFTKLDANGNELDDSATDWAMVKDNVTGLIWEVKTDDGSIHDKNNTYAWYDSNPETNGGDPGDENGGVNTEQFINTLNSNNFGGYSDWRLPTIKELAYLTDLGTYNPTIDTNYFPDTVSSDTMSSLYWSSTTYADHTDHAWLVDFNLGHGLSSNKSSTYYVRAVRGGQ